MTRDDLKNDYFNWLCDLVCGTRYAKTISFRKLLIHLHGIEFRYIIPRDHNRAEDGVSLRYQFALENGYESSTRSIMDILDGPCSVFEMIVALAQRCEGIMDDPSIGARMRQWFWGMIGNLGLGSMTDDNFDRREVDEKINRFLDREYTPDGIGGLFHVRHCSRDLRNVEIWWQLLWYLDTIV